MEYRFDYGSHTVPLSLSPELVLADVAPAPVAGLSDVAGAVRTSLAAPVASAPLRDLLAGNSSVLILTVDHTRPSPAPLLLPVLDLCEEAGVRPTICVAVGRHRQMTPGELQRHLPGDILQRADLVQHDPFDDAAFESLGETQRGTPVLLNRIVFQHDVVIGIGIVEPSYLAGFSGGRKLIMPGIAHATSIDHNHFLLTDPDTRIGKLHGNPLSEDCAEVSRRAPYHFICYAVVGPDDEVVAVVSGDPYVAHEAACRRSAEVFRVAAVGADVIIASPGGSPYDCDLVQAKKAVVPASGLVNRGGVIILLGECGEGVGAEATFTDWLRTMTPQEVVKNVRDRSLFSLGAHGANILARPIAERDATVILVTCPEMCDLLDDTYVRAVPSVQEAWQMAQSIAGPDPSVVILRKARRLIVDAPDAALRA